MNKTIQCEICGRWFSSKGIGSHKWRVHGDGKNFNPNRGYIDGSRQAWNKGFTKENNATVARISESLRRVKSKLEVQTDDDGKLRQRYSNKRVNAQKEGIEFNLSYEEYCQLVSDACLKSSQLGFSGCGYVLGRYNDTGAYEVGNCRFITQYENSEEKLNRLYPNRKNRKSRM